MKRTRCLMALLALIAAGCWISRAPEEAFAQSAKAEAAKAADQQRAAGELERAAWPRWRGPHGDGISVETGLLAEWPDSGPPLAWRAKGLGAGYSSVVLSGGQILTLGNKGGKNNMVCL